MMIGETVTTWKFYLPERYIQKTYYNCLLIKHAMCLLNIMLKNKSHPNKC